ncbi:MAG: hypothetical protein ABL921_16310 [Pirellula sp.]
MSTTHLQSNPRVPNEITEHESVIAQLVEGETAWDRRLIALSNWVNPILVKETRQALKSRQFSVTLMLLTIVVLGWSLFSIIGMIPSIYYASNGTMLLMGYAIILIVPSLIIIPQAAFRSMASELEDGTFETLSLSMLSPGHILLGKLSVAGLQLLIYLSVIAPCIALTYLLRGVTLDVIAMTLLLLSSCSLALSAIAISVASFSRNRMQQVFYSIVLLSAQVVVAFIGGAFLTGIVGYGIIPIEGWISFMIFLLAVLMYSWLFLRCGGCAIGVASENRSSPVRVPLLVNGLLVAMFSGFFSVCYGDRNSMSQMLASSNIFLFMHWGIAGSIMMGEYGVIPARARRSLPSSRWGRLFLTWLNPGAGPGFIFVVLSFVGSAFALVLAPWFLVNSTRSNISLQLVVFTGALACYLILYLGTVRLIAMIFLRKIALGRLIVSFTITIVLVVLSVVLTCSLSLAVNDYRTIDFDWYVFPNFFWTLGELFPGNQEKWTSPECLFAVVGLILTSGIVGFINVLLTAKDVVLLRIETPERVVQERQKMRQRKSSMDDEPNELEGLAAE